MRPGVGRFARVAGGIAATVAAIVTLLWAASGTETVREYVRDLVLATLRDALVAEVRLGRVGGTLGQRLVLEDLRIRVPGRSVIHVPRLEAVYALPALLRGVARLDHVTLDAPRVRTLHDEEGWHLPALRADGGGAGWPLVIRRLEVREGRLAWTRLGGSARRRTALTRIDAEAAITLAGGRREIRLRRLRATPRGIAVGPVEASGDLLLRDGETRLRGLRVVTAHSDVAGSATIAPGADLTARLRLAPLAARDVRALWPELELRADLRLAVAADGPWSAVTLRGRAHAGEAGSVAAAADLDLTATPVRHAAHVRLDDLDAGAVYGALPRGRLTGHLRAAGHGLGGTRAVTWALHLGPSVVGGHDLAAFLLDARTTRGAHRLHARARRAGLESRARLWLSPGPPLTYRATARARAVDLGSLRHPAGRLAGRLTLRGEGVTPRDRRASLHARLAEVSAEGDTRALLDARVDLERERLRAEPVRLTGPGLDGSASGFVDLRAGRAEGTLAAAADAALVLAPYPALAGGALRLEARAQGPLDALAVSGVLTGAPIAAGTAEAARARLVVDLRGIGGATPAGTARFETEALRVTGRLLGEGALDATWERTGARDRIDVRGTAGRAAGPGGVFDGTLTHTRGHATATLRTATLRPPHGPAWSLLRPATFTVAGAVATEGATFAAGPQEIRLAGRVATTGADATVALRDVDLAPWCRIVGAGRCGGTLSGEAAVHGSAAAPRLDATVRGSALRAGDFDYGRLDATAAYAARRLDLRATLRHPQAGELRLDGHVPVDLSWSGRRRDVTRDPVDLTLTAEGLDLALLRTLFPGHVRESTGRAHVDLHVRGSRADPRAHGTVALDGGRCHLVAAGVPYDDVRLRLEAIGTAVVVRELHARSGDGTLDADGRLALGVGDASRLALVFRLDEFLVVRRPAYEAALGGRLEVGGRLGAPEITGALDVGRAVVRPADLPASGSALEPDPTITVVGGPLAVRATPPPPPPALLEALRLGVAVRIARNAWIRRVDANIELGGSLRLDKEPSAPLHVGGRIDLLRGWYAFQGRRFEIDEGIIAFSDPPPARPSFDVRGTHRAGPYRIQAHVEGPVDKPHLTLSSDPPLEQADILAVLLFGKPTSELGKGQSAGLQQRALRLATGYVMPELQSSVMDTLGLDSLAVELPQDDGSGGRVSVGRYVAQDVFVSLAQEFGTSAAEVIGVEYGLTRDVSVRGSTSTRGDSAVDVFWHRRY